MAPIGESRFGRAASENRVGRIHPDIASSQIRHEPSRGGEDMRAPSAKPRRYIREERESPSLSSLTKACEIHTANPAINDKLIKRVFAIKTVLLSHKDEQLAERQKKHPVTNKNTEQWGTGENKRSTTDLQRSTSFSSKASFYASISTVKRVWNRLAARKLIDRDRKGAHLPSFTRKSASQRLSAIERNSS